MRRNTTAFGKAAYTLQQINSHNPRMVGLSIDGSILVDQLTGHNIEWKVVATWNDVQDYLTGQSIPKNTTTMWLENYYGYQKGLHILLDNYKTAFSTSNTSWIEKMKKIGLTSGLILD